MWSEGFIIIPADIAGKETAVRYWVKHYDNPSKYGINKGRISKLVLTIKGKLVCNYDRGWGTRPVNKAAEAALEILICEYDRRNEDE